MNEIFNFDYMPEYHEEECDNVSNKECVVKVF